MPNINRLEPFTAFANVYQAAGFSAYSENLAPRLLDMGYEMEWSGRTLLDLGCGTGDAACWFAEHGFRAKAVDASAHMLRYGKQRADKNGIDVTFINEDIRTYKPDTTSDIVLSLGGVLNYMPTIRDIESIFQVARSALTAGKLFIFDLHTIRGLAQTSTERIVANNNETVFVASRSDFNYENLSLTTQYSILVYDGKTGWQRGEETHVLHGYPIQNITKLLTQSGFMIRRSLTPDLQQVNEPGTAEMLLFVAMRTE
jgi:SAM-dependent methyltransferase